MNHLVDVLKERCRTDADNAAFLVKRDDRWEPTTWADVDAESDRIAAALLAIGLEKADSVCILSSTRLEWTLSDLGIIKAGGVSIGIYQTLSGEQAAYILADSQAKFLFIEDPGQAEKFCPIFPSCLISKKSSSLMAARKTAAWLPWTRFCSKGQTNWHPLPIASMRLFHPLPPKTLP